jgi:hypothetical protein
VEHWREQLWKNVHRDVGQIRTRYDKSQVRGLLSAIFDVEYPPDLFRDHLSKEAGEEMEQAKRRAVDKAAAFVEKHFSDGAGMILLLLVMIGKNEGEWAMPEYLSMTPPKIYHNVRGYKRWACLLMTKFIDYLRLGKNKGGRRKDELTSAIEAALAELSQSEVKVSQEGIENYLRRKTGKAISLEAARKRLDRKGKSLSEAKGKKRKGRKKK